MFLHKPISIIFIIAFLYASSFSLTFQGSMRRELKNKKLELPVQFDLVIAEGSGEVKGSYFYRKIGQRIELSGTYNGKILSLTERDNQTGKISGIFTMEFSEGQLSGIWNKADGKDTFLVILNQAEPVSIDGFWDGVIGKEKVRFFLNKPDNPYGLYYLLSEKFLITCEYSQSDSAIIEFYSDYPVKDEKGGIWKYSYLTEDTMRGTIKENLHYNSEYEPGTPFILIKRLPSFCNDFYGTIDSAFIIKIEDTTDYGVGKLFSKIVVHNSGLHYNGIQICSPIPNQSKINRLLRTIIPLDGESKAQVLKKRKGNCAAPSDYDDYAAMNIIDWGERYLTVMIEQGEFPRYLNFSTITIDLQKTEIVDPSGWFNDSMKCLAYKGSVKYSDNFNGDNCEEVCQNFFAKLYKTGKINLQIDKDDHSKFVFDNEVISLYITLFSPSEDGVNFNLYKTNSYNDFIQVPIEFDDIKEFLTAEGIKALKPKN